MIKIRIGQNFLGSLMTATLFVVVFGYLNYNTWHWSTFIFNWFGFQGITFWASCLLDVLMSYFKKETK